MVLLLISSRYGRFPMFWQDLKEWENWNEVKKIYMKEKEKQELKADRRRKREDRWGEAKKRIALSRWDQDEREVDPGLPVAIAASVISIEELQIIELRMKMQEITNKIETVEEDAERISMIRIVLRPLHQNTIKWVHVQIHELSVCVNDMKRSGLKLWKRLSN